jgi:thiol-disulfide isomerase/thioredoxin
MLALASAAFAGAPARAAGTPDAFDPSAYKGKVIYLDFWASWCGPCKLSFPYMQKLESEFKDRDFVVVAINLDHSRASADRFIKQYGQGLEIYFDEGGALATKYKVKAMPTSLLIGRDGRIRYVHAGFFPEQIPTYNAQITELVSEQ